MSSRRRATVLGAGILAAATVAATIVTSDAAASWNRARGRTHRAPPLHSATVAVTGTGERVFLQADDLARLIPGTRALDRAAAAEQVAWLEAGTVPGPVDLAPVVRTALLDLDVLTLPNGAAAAGWSPQWRYVWPRDAAFVAAALTASGHQGDARRVLAFLERVQPESASFQARYTLDGSGSVPDDRGTEADGDGWVLWAADRLARAADDEHRTAVLESLSTLLVRSTRACLAAVADGAELPGAGLDYWEVPSDRPTLGLAAPILAGLEAAPPLLRAIGEPALAARAQEAAAALAERVARTFGANGYPREFGSSERDAAVTFLFPPFRQVAPGPDLVAAWRTAQHEMRRPAGGLAPGAGWRDDGISWTPETALFALTAAASGRTERILSPSTCSSRPQQASHR